jgi:hypothetical protein
MKGTKKYQKFHQKVLPFVKNLVIIKITGQSIAQCIQTGGSDIWRRRKEKYIHRMMWLKN